MIENTATYKFLIGNENHSFAVSLQPQKDAENDREVARRDAEKNSPEASGPRPSNRAREEIMAHSGIYVGAEAPTHKANRRLGEGGIVLPCGGRGIAVVTEIIGCGEVR